MEGFVFLSRQRRRVALLLGNRNGCGLYVCARPRELRVEQQDGVPAIVHSQKELVHENEELVQHEKVLAHRERMRNDDVWHTWSGWRNDERGGVEGRGRAALHLGSSWLPLCRSCCRLSGVFPQLTPPVQTAVPPYSFVLGAPSLCCMNNTCVWSFVDTHVHAGKPPVSAFTSVFCTGDGAGIGGRIRRALAARWRLQPSVTIWRT